MDTQRGDHSEELVRQEDKGQPRHPPYEGRGEDLPGARVTILQRLTDTASST